MNNEKEKISANQKKVAKVMHEFKDGELHSGKTDMVVTNPKQAIAIALSEVGNTALIANSKGLLAMD